MKWNISCKLYTCHPDICDKFQLKMVWNTRSFKFEQKTDHYKNSMLSSSWDNCNVQQIKIILRLLSIIALMWFSCKVLIHSYHLSFYTNLFRKLLIAYLNRFSPRIPTYEDKMLPWNKHLLARRIPFPAKTIHESGHLHCFTLLFSIKKVTDGELCWFEQNYHLSLLTSIPTDCGMIISSLLLYRQK